MKKLDIIKIAAAVLFAVSAFCTLDLGINFFYNLVPELHDGYATYSLLHGIFGIFPDHSWGFEMFFDAFKNSLWVSFGLLVLNLALCFWKKRD